MCTQEDFDQFYPLTDNLKGDLENTLKDKMFCIDDTDEPLGFNTGTGIGAEARYLYFQVEPCNRRNNYWPNVQNDIIREDCVPEKEL